MADYDLVVIGSGPAGEKGAAQAAYFGKRVALVEREPRLGGAAINTGTVPSKTLRETALYFSGLRIRPCSASITSASCRRSWCISVPTRSPAGIRLTSSSWRYTTIQRWPMPTNTPRMTGLDNGNAGRHKHPSEDAVALQRPIHGLAMSPLMHD
jgi:hypothetical protein